MERSLTLPHRVAPGLCPVNGIRDLIHWRAGRDWSNEFVHGLGQGGGFAYLRINPARPPRQVYWGIASPRQHKYLAELLGANFAEQENRSFKNTWKKACQAVEDGTPPILGPMDMYHLPFYPSIYKQRHIPIHYLLLVGYDAEFAYVHDTGQATIKQLPLAELESAWDVNVPGLGKRNRMAILDIPQKISATDSLVRQSIIDQCQMMLRPPVSMLGIPAMRKLSREICHWPDQLGQEAADRCLRHVREYLNSPPDVLGSHLTAGRDLYITFLEEAAMMTGLDLSEPVKHFRTVITIIPEIAESILLGDLLAAGSCFSQVARLEERAYSYLLTAVQ